MWGSLGEGGLGSTGRAPRQPRRNDPARRTPRRPSPPPAPLVSAPGRGPLPAPTPAAPRVTAEPSRDSSPWPAACPPSRAARLRPLPRARGQVTMPRRPSPWVCRRDSPKSGTGSPRLVERERADETEPEAPAFESRLGPGSGLRGASSFPPLFKKKKKKKRLDQTVTWEGPFQPRGAPGSLVLIGRRTRSGPSDGGPSDGGPGAPLDLETRREAA